MPERKSLPLPGLVWRSTPMIYRNLPITKVVDHRSHGVRNAIYVPLYPIAEWFVTNWWFLWHEWRLDRPDSRHNLLAAREGFALPDLSFLPTETRMQLVWRPKPANEFGRVSFLMEGSSILPKDIVNQGIRSFIDAVVQRLDDRGIADAFLADEWQAVLEAERDPDQKSFCEKAARLGNDPFDSEISIASYLEELDDLPQGVVDDFCDAVTLDQIPAGVAAVTGFLSSYNQHPVTGGRWMNLFKEMEVSNGLPPWQYGYQQARRLRSNLGFAGQSRPISFRS